MSRRVAPAGRPPGATMGLLTLPLAVLLACGGDAGTVHDAAPVPDAGAPDAPGLDAGSPDASAPDGGDGTVDGGDASTERDAEAPPSTLRVGTPETFDVVTWNVRQFPTERETLVRVAEIVEAMEVDLVALQEIREASAFDELAALLPDHEGAQGETDNPMRNAFLWRSSVLRLDALEEIVPVAPPVEWGARPVLHGRFAFTGSTPERVLDVYDVHLKAGGAAAPDRYIVHTLDLPTIDHIVTSASLGTRLAGSPRSCCIPSSRCRTTPRW